MATKEELQALADQEVEDAKPIKKATSDGVVEYTDDDYAQLKKDLGNQKWNDQQFGQIQARQQAYKPIEEQLDMQYWDSVNGTTTWKNHIEQVKTDNPKP